MALQLGLHVKTADFVSAGLSIRPAKSDPFDMLVRLVGAMTAGHAYVEVSAKAIEDDDWTIILAGDSTKSYPLELGFEGPYERIRFRTDAAFAGDMTCLVIPAC